ncbi:MAG: DUF559 domain-containing protein [Desulfomonilaceae bacterium]
MSCGVTELVSPSDDNTRSAPYIGDFYCREAALVVEVDGAAAHVIHSRSITTKFGMSSCAP